MRRYLYSGHHTYTPRLSWPIKVINAIEADPWCFDDEWQAALQLGVGHSMVKPMVFWSESLGLIENRGSALGMDRDYKKDGYFVTSFAKTILKHDPYFEDYETIWLLHWRLTTEQHFPLLAWRYVFNRLHEPYWSQSALVDLLAAETDNKISVAILKEHVSVFCRIYEVMETQDPELIMDNIFYSVDLLRDCGKNTENEDTYALDRGSVEIPNARRISDPLFAYVVNEFCHNNYPRDSGFIANELVWGLNSPGRVLAMHEESVYSQCETLDALTKGAITMGYNANKLWLYRHRELDSMQLLNAIYLDTQ